MANRQDNKEKFDVPIFESVPCVGEERPVFVGSGARLGINKQKLPADVNVLRPVMVKIDDDGKVDFYVTENADGTGEIFNVSDNAVSIGLLKSRLEKAWELYYKLFWSCSAFSADADAEKIAKERWDRAMDEADREYNDNRGL